MSFTTDFCYLGNALNGKLDGTQRTEKRIQKANQSFCLMSKRMFRNRNICLPAGIKACNAAITSLLLWGCESWATTKADQKKLDAFHTRCLRRVLNITIYEAMEKHVKNEDMFETPKSMPLYKHVELRKCRWLHKLAKMSETRFPRLLLGAWLPASRLLGRPQQTIRHSYHHASCNVLSFDSSDFSEWMPMARDTSRWSERVETHLDLPSGAF